MQNKHTNGLLTTDSYLNDQLFDAVNDLDVTRVEEAIKNGGDAKFYLASTGETLLHVAVSAATLSNDFEKTKNVIKICELLVKHGANLEQQGSVFLQHKSGCTRRCTPLFCCVDYFCSSHQALFCELTKTLLHLGADVNALNEEVFMNSRIRFGAIHLACRECNESILKILIEESGGKAQIDLPAQLEGENKEHFTCTPLHFACNAKNALGEVLLLLKYGADVNKPCKSRCDSEDTPLHMAIRLIDPFLVQTLLAFGADPQIPQIVEGRKIDTAKLFSLHFTWLPWAMLKLPYIQWSPDFHKSLAPEVKSQMLTLLLCFQRLRIPLTCWKHPAVECIFKAVLRNFILGKLPPEKKPH